MMTKFFNAVGREIASAFLTNVHFIGGHPLLVVIFAACVVVAFGVAYRIGR